MHSSAKALGKELADFLGYDLLSLPKEAAAVGAVGFITYAHYLILDKRAKKTKQFFDSETSYKLLPTPLPLTKTNKHEGTLRCMTKEFPYALDDFILLPPKESPSYVSNAPLFSVYGSFFSKTQLVVAQGNARRILFKDALKHHKEELEELLPSFQGKYFSSSFFLSITKKKKKDLQEHRHPRNSFKELHLFDMLCSG